MVWSKSDIQKLRSYVENHSLTGTNSRADWKAAAGALEGAYTPQQCKAKWRTLCDKHKAKPWRDPERALLEHLVTSHKRVKWDKIARFFFARTAKQCEKEWVRIKTSRDNTKRLVKSWTVDELRDMLISGRAKPDRSVRAQQSMLYRIGKAFLASGEE